MHWPGWLKVLVSLRSWGPGRWLGPRPAEEGVTKPSAQCAHIIHVLTCHQSWVTWVWDTCAAACAAAVLGTVGASSWRGCVVWRVACKYKNTNTVSTKLGYWGMVRNLPEVYLRRDSNGKVFSPGFCCSPGPERREMRKVRMTTTDAGLLSPVDWDYWDTHTKRWEEEREIESI